MEHTRPTNQRAVENAAREQRERRLASIAHASRYGSCSPATIRRRIADGTLTGYRFGPKLIRVDLDEIDTLLQPIPTVSNG